MNLITRMIIVDVPLRAKVYKEPERGCALIFKF